MGIFDSFFGPKASPQATNVAVSETIPRIQASRNVAEVRNNIQLFGSIDNPSIQYTLGVTCLMFDMQSDAKRHYLLGAKHGLKGGGQYYNTPHADSIGQCLTHLLTQFSLSDSDAIDKATTLAYMYLSKCISAYGDNAYDSRRSRAILLKDHESPWTIQRFIMQHSMGQFKEVLILADLFESAKGLASSNLGAARDSIATATSLHRELDDMSVAGKDADEYSLSEIAEIGSNRSEMVFRKLEPSFLQGDFNLTEAELRSILA